jgi:lipopolysaccharide export system permease protein
MDFFPSRTIAWYMAKMFLFRSFAVLAGLVLVLMALDLLGETDKIMKVEGNGSAEIWRYVGFRVPQIIARFLPFSILLGTLITMITLNQNSEVISMKAAGLSAHQVLAPLILASLVVAVLSFAFNDRIVSRATATLNRWQKIEYAPLPADPKAISDVWIPDGNNLMNVQTVGKVNGATELGNITYYDRASGALDAIVTADKAIQSGNAWALSGIKRFDIQSGAYVPAPPMTIAQGIKPTQFRPSNIDADGISFRKLYETIGEMEAEGRSTQEMKSKLWHKISGPLSTVLMPLLAAVAAFGVARSGKLFVRAVIGMALGFAYFVADNFGLAMGNLGAYPPLLAAWGPFFLFLLIGETVLIRTEE